jgi:hypothetical protein
MTERERDIVIGTVLGDAFLQKTGKKNARVRFEHSLQQKEYIFWKWRELQRYMQDRPKLLVRFNPVWQKCYSYYRCQSHASPIFGKWQAIFYLNHRKQVPHVIGKLFRRPLSLAVWFMDDGYYYKRDKTAYIYLSPLRREDTERLQQMFAENFGLHPRLEIKKTKAMNFKFSVAETKKLISIITPHVIVAMRYKLGKGPRID